MKYLIIFTCILFACGGHNHHQKTPSSIIMTQEEKTDVNYDARENKKVIEENAAHKKRNAKKTQRAKKKQTEQLNELNKNSNKTKKKTTKGVYLFY